MYELWGGGGSPFTVVSADVLLDRARRLVRLFPGVRKALEFAVENQVLACVASSTDEPAWARECMDKFGLTSAFTHVAIHKGSKKTHLREIFARTKIPFEDVLFLDNEYYNIESVKELGVVCAHVEEGLTAEAWERALRVFAETKAT